MVGHGLSKLSDEARRLLAATSVFQAIYHFELALRIAGLE